MIFVTFLIDVSILPLLVTPAYCPMLTLVTINCIGLVLGSVRGIWYGLAGGLMMDIAVGSPFGMWAILFALMGFGGGFMSRVFRKTKIIVPLISGALCRIICEIVFTFMLMFTGVRFSAQMFSQAGVRMLIEMVLTIGLYWLYSSILLRPDVQRKGVRL